MQYIDTHTHVQFLAYASDRDEVLKRAKTAGVRMITVGTQAATSETGIELAEKHPEDIWATVGFHPAHANIDWFHDKNEQLEATPETFDAERLRELARHPRVVAIGECGLDYYRASGVMHQASREKQKEVFIQQIEIAREVGKPLMIHCREAFSDLIDILVSCHMSLVTPPGVIHSFDGTIDEARELLNMGFSFTFAGNITFKPRPGRPIAADVIKFLPIDRILSETDAPYLTPVPHRGERNEPAYVVEVVKKLADVKGVSLEKMAEQIMNSARAVFRI
ncbi:MAG: TatD family hydrolase [Candidatus Liptonbacteria bacterium]|nr:TatD family hydrolase [Candidatus Liptonbacteria bacterium]